MEDCAKDSNKNDQEVKPKKKGFFRRLKRGFTSIFQRKTNRRRNKSEPCLPGILDNSPKLDEDNEARLNNDNQSNDKPDELGDNQTSGGSSIKPLNKPPMLVNFQAELKKSLLHRSKMVEEGQTSEAIVQIEMTRSNYSVSEEEVQKEIEKKTFEEKLALFESQISGGSLHNSLKRNSKSGEDRHEITDKEEEEEENNFENLKETLTNNDNIEKVSLKISELDTTITLENSNLEELTEFNNRTEEGFTNYELTISEDIDQKMKEEIDSPLKDTLNVVNDNFDKTKLNDNGSNKAVNEVTSSNIVEIENIIENCQKMKIIEEKESELCNGEQLNHGILMNETNPVQTNEINHT